MLRIKAVVDSLLLPIRQILLFLGIRRQEEIEIKPVWFSDKWRLALRHICFNYYCNSLYLDFRLDIMA